MSPAFTFLIEKKQDLVLSKGIEPTEDQLVSAQFTELDWQLAQQLAADNAGLFVLVLLLAQACRRQHSCLLLETVN